MANKNAKEFKIKFIDHISEDIRNVLGYIVAFFALLVLVSLCLNLVNVSGGYVESINAIHIAFGKTYVLGNDLGTVTLSAVPEYIIALVFIIAVIVFNIIKLPKYNWIKNLVLDAMIIYCLATFIELPTIVAHHATITQAMEMSIWGIIDIVIVSLILIYSLFLTLLDYKEIIKNKEKIYKGLYIFFIAVIFFSLFVGILCLHKDGLSRIYTGGKFILGEENETAFLSITTLNPNELIEGIYCATVALAFIGLKANVKPNKWLNALICLLAIFVGYYMLFIKEDAFADCSTTGISSLTPYGLFAIIISVLFAITTILRNIKRLESKDSRIKAIQICLLIFVCYTAFYNVLSGQMIVDGAVYSETKFAGTTIISMEATYASSPVNGIYTLLSYCLLIASLIITAIKIKPKYKYLASSILLIGASIMYIFMGVKSIEAAISSNYYNAAFTTNGLLGLIALMISTVLALYITAVTPNKINKSIC